MKEESPSFREGRSQTPFTYLTTGHNKYMPKVFNWKGHRFHFFSNEGEPLEPVHIHVQKGSCRAKYWLKPIVSLEHNYGFSAKELNKFKKVIEEHKDLIEEKWNEHFNI
jgi:hypothetical protein